MTAYKDDDGRWRWRAAHQGHRYSGTAPKLLNTKKAAEALERAKMDQVVSRNFEGVMPNMAAFATQFLAHQKDHVKPLTFRSQKNVVNLHIVPHLRTTKLEDITTAEVDRIKALWSGKPRTKNLRLAVLSNMLNLAVDWGILKVTPKIRMLKVPKDTPRFLEQFEATALIAEADDTWRSMLVVALRTGLRIGELRGLQWGDIDLSAAMLHVRRTDPGLADMKSNAPKGNRPRTLPLTPDAQDALRSQFELAPRKGSRDWVWGGAESWHGKVNRNRTRSEAGCSHAIRALVDRVVLPNGKPIDDRDEIAWHTMRHTFASWLVIRGVSLRVVMDLLGHASMKQTERYAHLAPNAVHHDAVSVLDFAVLAPGQQAAKQLAGGLDTVNEDE